MTLCQVPRSKYQRGTTLICSCTRNRSTALICSCTNAANKRLNEIEKAIAQCHLLEALSKTQRSRIAEACVAKNFTDGEYIIKQGSEGSVFYIIAEGEVVIHKTTPGQPDFEGSLEVGNHFGEQALLNNAPRAASIIAKNKVKCLALHREQFDQLLGPLADVMEQHHAGRLEEEAAGGASGGGAGGAAASGQSGGGRRDSRMRVIDLSQLTSVAILGEGAFGIVKLMRHKVTNRPYALKAMQKARVVATRQQENVVNEKKLLQECAHPYILRIESTMQDADCLYLLLEFLQGGDMFGKLVEYGGCFKEPIARCVVPQLRSRRVSLCCLLRRVHLSPHHLPPRLAPPALYRSSRIDHIYMHVSY